NVPLTAQSGSQFLFQTGSGLLIYLSDVTSTGATFNVSSGKTLSFYYGTTHSFDAASTIGGSGTVEWYGTNTVNGTYNMTGATRSISGTTTIGNITSVGDVTAQGGTLTL